MYEHTKMEAYKALFGPEGGHNPAAVIVLEDLYKFCRLNESSIVATPTGLDTNATLVCEGRREVALRIKNMLKEVETDD